MNSSGPQSPFKVALIQTRPKPNDPAYNFEYASQQIRLAASQQASLAILPEYHLTAFEPTSPKFIPCAQTCHKYISGYQDLARELSINICAGTIVLTPEPEDPDIVTYAGENENATLLNTSYFIDSKGDILGSYTKTNLWHPEREHLTSSIEHQASLSRTNTNVEPDTAGDKTVPSLDDDNASTALSKPKPALKPSSHEEGLPQPHQVIETPLGPIGILVCWDLAFPEAFRTLILAGAKIILIPTFWVLSDMSEEGLRYNKLAERLFLQSTLVSRAFENTCAVIFCNAGGPESDGFIGLSQVALPIVGTLEGSFTGPKEGMSIVDVDMEIVEVAERNYKVREDLQRQDWHYGYRLDNNTG